jgi:hypothetical protein
MILTCPEARILPSGVKASALMLSLYLPSLGWTLDGHGSVVRKRPSGNSYSLMLLLWEPEARVLPSGVIARAVTQSVS